MNPDLSQLRDIHLPPPLSWWPPAPGWWLLLVLLSILLALGLWLWRRHQQGHWRREALRALDELCNNTAERSTAGQIRELSILLRRVAVTRFPRTEVAALTGDRWLQFLGRSLGDEALFQHQAGVLLSAPYRPDSATETESAALFELCRRWIKTLPGGRRP